MKATDKYANKVLIDYCIDIALQKKKPHKCEVCVWGTWTGTKYKCSLPRCMPKLGNFNGVGKNG